MVHALDDIPLLPGQRTPKASPAKLWYASEPPFKGYRGTDSGYKQTTAETAIIVDNGRSLFWARYLPIKRYPTY